VGVALLVLGFAPVTRFHIERMPQAKGDPFFGAEVGEPVPREPALDRHDQIVPLGRNNPQKRRGGRRQIFMDEFRAMLIEDTDVHRFGL
jgi:hypothetical protein